VYKNLKEGRVLVENLSMWWEFLEEVISPRTGWAWSTKGSGDTVTGARGRPKRKGGTKERRFSA